MATDAQRFIDQRFREKAADGWTCKDQLSLDVTEVAPVWSQPEIGPEK